jgi:anti-sigma B factor antagonist
VDLRLGHHAKDGDEIIDVQAKSTCIPRRGLRELRIDLVSTGSYQLVLNLEGRVPGSAGLGALVGGLRRVRAHDGSLDLVCTQQRILKILKITGLTEVFGIYETADQAIAASKGRR